MLDERLDLRVRGHRHEAMLDLTWIVGQQVGFEARGAVRIGARELAGLAVERGREEHRLPVLRQTTDDPVDLGLEPHVEHPVGLVEDEGPDSGQVDEASLCEVLQPPGSCDEDLRALGTVRLRPEGQPAVRGRDREALGLSEPLELCGHLGRELSGRDEHERRGAGIAGHRALDDRQREGERLARPRRRASENVQSCERIGKDELLDPKRMVD